MPLLVLVDTRKEYRHLQDIYAPIGLVVLALVVGVVAFAVIRYRARDGRTPSRKTEASTIEGAYALLLVAIVAFLVHETFTTSKRVDARASTPALRVDVTASDWVWRFDYPRFGISQLGHPGQPAELVVPLEQTVEFDLTSLDVVHAFWIPEQRFQRDAFPSRTTRFDLVFDHTGTEHNGRCVEFCGQGHSDMRFTVRVLTPDQFAAWVRQATPANKRPPAQRPPAQRPPGQRPPAQRPPNKQPRPSHP